MRRIATLVAAGAPQQEIFDRVCEEVCRHLDGDLSNMCSYEPGDSVLAVAGYAVPGQRAVPVGMRLQLDPTALAYRVRETGCPQRIDYLGAPGTLARYLRDDLGLRASVAAPIVVNGVIWGYVSAARVRDEPIPDDAEERIGEFTELVALAIGNAEARRELEQSRARLVEASDAERRRLERNLHDGAQQRLVSLALQLRLALRQIDGDAGTTKELLEQASQDLDAALEELRELARGIHPAVLTDRGLGPALAALAARCPLPVEIREVPEQRVPEQVEAAAYYLVAEALTNAAKHAQAASASVDVAQSDGHLRVVVADDGVGGAESTGGSGLVGLKDRVEALGGRLEVRSPAGAGTQVVARIPVS